MAKCIFRRWHINQTKPICGSGVNKSTHKSEYCWLPKWLVYSPVLETHGMSTFYYLTMSTAFYLEPWVLSITPTMSTFNSMSTEYFCLTLNNFFLNFITFWMFRHQIFITKFVRHSNAKWLVSTLTWYCEVDALSLLLRWITFHTLNVWFGLQRSIVI